jgi:NADH-quinone oxidoreductase subunit L
MLNGIWIVPLCPLLGALLNGFFGRRYSRTTVGQLAIAAVGVPFLLSLAALVSFVSGTAASYQLPVFTW